MSDIKHQIILRMAGCICADLSGTTAILHPETGLYFGLNDVGTQIWNHLAKPRTRDEIVQFVLSEYDISENQCRQDIALLLAALEKHKLVSLS